MNTIINGDLELKWIGTDPREGDLYRLLKTLHVQIGGVVDIAIPGHPDNGYVTKGASIPRWLWLVAGHPMRGQYQLAATVHDYFCTEAKRHNSLGLRNIGDAVFRELLRISDVPEWKCRAMYAAVRAAGWWSFLGGR